MIKAIIIDDESKARDLLELLINELDNEVQVLAKAHDLPSGITAIKNHHPDVVFLDIEMPELSGLQLLEFIPDPDFEIIFTTAYDQYAIKAFELSALDYLLKPIDDEKLANSINKLGKKLDIKTRLQTFQENRLQQSPHKICIPTSQSDYEIIQVKNIIAIEADRNYSIIHTTQKKHIISKSLIYFEDKYFPLPNFRRIHRSWIVNFEYIEQLNTSSKELLLPNLRVPISRTQFPEVKKIILSS